MNTALSNALTRCALHALRRRAQRVRVAATGMGSDDGREHRLATDGPDTLSIPVALGHGIPSQDRVSSQAARSTIE